MWFAEVTGYLASVLLAISLIVNNDIKFRWINSLGCITFIVYGILIKASPIILTNGILFLINLVYLIKIYRTDENFRLLEFENENVFIDNFIHFYEKDIRTYFPLWAPGISKGKTLSFAVVRDMVIANVFIATVDESGVATVNLNYTVPKYRDFKVGRYLFQKKKNFFTEKGINRIIYTNVSNHDHERFLKIIGFHPSVQKGVVYELQL